MATTRRAWLGWLVLAACTPASPATAPPATTPQPPPDRRVERLTDLLTAVRLEWLVLLEPAELMASAWLRPALGRILRDDRLDLLAKNTGIDLRRVAEIALASYAGDADSDDAIAYFLRHPADALAVERKFRQRLTGGEERIVGGHQLVRVWGRIGTREHGFVGIGPDVVGYQYGGSATRGPVRIAELYARGELEGVPRALADPALGSVHQRIAHAPALVLIPGPFEGAMARGARGLLGAADALGASITPSPSQTLRLDVILAGAYPSDAVPYLAGAWADLAASDLGHLLGLHQPRTAPAVRHTGLGLELTVELDPTLLFDGLVAATIADIREIMR